MTGGRIKKIEPYLEGDNEFLLTYGDGVGNIDITASIEYHRKCNRVLTLTGVRPPGRFGELEMIDGMVTTFFEKPQVTGGRINGGYFVAKKELFNYLSNDEALIFEQ